MMYFKEPMERSAQVAMLRHMMSIVPVGTSIGSLQMILSNHVQALKHAVPMNLKKKKLQGLIDHYDKLATDLAALLKESNQFAEDCGAKVLAVYDKGPHTEELPPVLEVRILHNSVVPVRPVRREKGFQEFRPMSPKEMKASSRRKKKAA